MSVAARVAGVVLLQPASGESRKSGCTYDHILFYDVL